MRFLWSRYKLRILLFLAVFGPATITAISDNDAAGVATYSLAGAQFGYSILIILIPITLLLAVTQEMGVRIAVVTGKGLGDLIRERYGAVLSIFIFFILLVANLGTVVANFSALKATATMFHIPPIFLILGVVIFSFLFITKGSYKTNQRLFLFGIIFYFAYLFSAFNSRPDWGRATLNLFVPLDVTLSKEFIFAAIAVLGTTITPWGQFFVQSFIIDKHIQPDKLKFSQLETYFGAFLTDFFTFFMIVATAATLYTHGVALTSGEQAALAIKPFAGELASLLFGLGLFNAAIMGIVIISLTTAYAFSEFFGVTGSIDAPFERGKMFYGLFLFQLLAAAAIVLLPSVSLFAVVFYTQSLNALLLPMIFFFLLKFTNNKDLMGIHTNPKFYNYFAIAASVIIVCASSFVVVSTLLSP